MKFVAFWLGLRDSQGADVVGVLKSPVMDKYVLLQPTAKNCRRVSPGVVRFGSGDGLAGCGARRQPADAL